MLMESLSYLPRIPTSQDIRLFLVPNCFHVYGVPQVIQKLFLAIHLDRGLGFGLTQEVVFTLLSPNPVDILSAA